MNSKITELPQKVKRKREIVKHGHEHNWTIPKIQERVRVEHAEARRYIVEQFMVKGSVGAEVGVDWGDFATIVIQISSPSTCGWSKQRLVF